VAGGPPPPPGDVFFVETSEQTSPSYLFLCSVESAARTHPGTRVVVLMKGLHEYIELCMQDFVDNYNGWIWAHQGPELLTRVFKKWCSISNIQNNMSCKGVRALPPEVVYPVPWPNWKKLFE
ncbi:PREDICTED: lactosylceramide 4-alpha-galactosyltransferase-like, partial [Chlamydotis macqueenii]|uniref:lactosylceramide 4-alpha-galactosyltransferase-like n=1 Tax=Chlamydotis macqueenii TaxID=187382 RepID=UPI000529B697